MKNFIAVVLHAMLLALVAACGSLKAGQSPAAPVQESQYVLLLWVNTIGSSHTITRSQLVPSTATLSLPLPVADGTSLNYAVADSAGKLVFEASMPNPLEVRTPLPQPGEPQQGHRHVTLPQGEYLIRMPYDRTAATMQIVVGAKPVFAPPSAAAAQSGISPPPGAQTLDLRGWVRTAESEARVR